MASIRKIVIWGGIMNYSRLITVLLGLCSTGAMAATTIVMDFEGVVADDEVALFQAPYSEDGLTLTHSGGAGEGIFGSNYAGSGFGEPPNSNSNGTSVYGWCSAETEFGSACSNAQIGLSADMPYTSFRLLSLDLANLHNYEYIATTGTFSIIGNLAAGGTVSKTYEFTLDTWGTVTFDNSWSGLTSISVSAINNPSFDSAIDNITVSAVPVPAAVWLFGSALAGLGWMHRRKTA